MTWFSPRGCLRQRKGKHARAQQAPLSAGNGFNSAFGESMRRSLLTRGFSGGSDRSFERGRHAASAQQAAQGNRGLGAIQLRQPAVREGGQNFRMNVTLATDGWRVAQPPGDRRNRLNQLLLDFALVANRAFAQRLQSFHGGKPGAEVLGGEGTPARLPQI